MYVRTYACMCLIKFSLCECDFFFSIYPITAAPGLSTIFQKRRRKSSTENEQLTHLFCSSYPSFLPPPVGRLPRQPAYLDTTVTNHTR